MLQQPVTKVHSLLFAWLFPHLSQPIFSLPYHLGAAQALDKPCRLSLILLNSLGGLNGRCHQGEVRIGNPLVRPAKHARP